MELFGLFDATLLNSLLRFATPILLAALGGLLCERAGVLNIGLEGLMLAGAFGAVVGSFFGESALVGVLAGVVAGSLFAALFALFAITLRGNEIVVGIAINLLASGLTVYLLRSIFGVKGAFQDPALVGLRQHRLPGLEAIPVLGPLLSGHSVLVYLALLLTLALHLLLFRHVVGLRLRGVGEHAEAATTLGVHVGRVRWSALLASGALCGLAGAQLSLGNVTLFVENMSAGRGWIAVVAVMFGRAHPFGVLAACLLFGLTESLGFRLQGLRLPSQLTESLPYVVTLASLFFFRRSARSEDPQAV
jgi:simple sugar transport system permease protein